MKAIVGKQDKSNRSDCYIELEILDSGGIQLEMSSKVEALFGKQNRELINELINFFEIVNAKIYIEDYGALPFVLAARFETVYKRIFPNSDKKFLFPFSKHSKTKSNKERLRRSRLYLPGNSPKLFMNAGLHKPDGIILDLEDSVSPSEKDAARILVRNALRTVNFYNSERMVRINQLPLGLLDLEEIIPNRVNLILIPKVESEEEIHTIENKIKELKKLHNIKDEIFLMPIIESAKGIGNAYSIAKSSQSISSLAIGLEDYTADIGAERTNEGKESFYARSVIVNAAKAAGIQAIDTVFSDVSDMEGLMNSVLEAKSLGFEGKGCIHPRQIQVVHQGFAPKPEEIEKAKKIVEAFKDAESKGLGVVSLGNKMIDPPVVKRALKIVNSNW